MTDFTTNLHLELPDFNVSTWHDAVNNNFITIDAAVRASTGFTGITGLWENAHIYAVGEKLIDEVTNTVWRVMVNHTSINSPGTFNDDRVANPTYWSIVDTGIAYVGLWQTGFLYSVGDFVYSTTEAVAAVCTLQHVSANLRTDQAAGKWAWITDLKTARDAATTAASAAATSQSAAGSSATAAASSASAAASSASAASTSASGAATSASGASTSATNAANSATAAAASATAAANAFTQQVFIASGTWTKPAGCKKIIVEGVGGGGGGGGATTGAAGTAGAGAGGGSGAYGMSEVIDVTSITSCAVVIGAAGAGGAIGTVGGTGGITTFIGTGISLTWGGGTGGAGVTGTTSGASQTYPGQPGGAASMVFGGSYGGPGYGNAAAGVAISGWGGCTPFGNGGPPKQQVGTGSSVGQSPDPSQYGAGGSGAVVVGATTSRAGAAGSAGRLRVWEFY